MRDTQRAALAATVAIATVAARYVRYRRHARLRGAVAVVTGGSRGLGLLVARELARRGCRLAICARDAGELDRARADLRTRGAQVLAVRCDVADARAARDLIDQVVRHYGRLDVLVNNAGVIQVGPFAAMSADHLAEAMRVMYWGTVHTTLPALEHLRRRGGGRIANITSIGGKISVPHLLPYCTAKFAAVAFSEGLRAELAGSGVTVTTVVPGLMRTGSHLNARFLGRSRQEFTWFGALASLPGVSMDARRAARQIVAALAAGRPELVLTLPGKVAVRLAGVAPATMSRLLAVAGRVLPGPDGGPGGRGTGRSGTSVLAEKRSPGLRAVTVLGLRAARRYNQHAPAAH